MNLNEVILNRAAYLLNEDMELPTFKYTKPAAVFFKGYLYTDLNEDDCYTKAYKCSPDAKIITASENVDPTKDEDGFTHGAGLVIESLNINNNKITFKEKDFDNTQWLFGNQSKVKPKQPITMEILETKNGLWSGDCWSIFDLNESLNEENWKIGMGTWKLFKTGFANEFKKQNVKGHGAVAQTKGMTLYEVYAGDPKYEFAIYYNKDLKEQNMLSVGLKNNDNPSDWITSFAIPAKTINESITALVKIINRFNNDGVEEFLRKNAEMKK